MLERIVRWIYTHQKTSVILLVVVILFFIVVQFFTQNAIMVVNVNTPQQTTDITTSASRPEGTERVGSTGLMLIPRNTTSLIVSAGAHSKTEVKIAIPWYGVGSVDVNLVADRNAEKIAYMGMYGDASCATYSMRLASLLSYKCTNPPSLLQYVVSDTTDWGNKAVAKNMLYPGKVAQPYMGGVIGISSYALGDESAPQPIIYTTDKGEVINYNMPEGIDESSLSYVSIFSNTTDPTDNRFVFVTADGTVYLGTPQGQKGAVRYSKVTAPANYTKTPHKTLCRIATGYAYCYTGGAPVGDMSASASRDDTIRVIDFNGSVISSAELRTNLLLSALYVTEGGDIYGKSYKKIIALHKVGATYETNEISQNADDAVATKNLYYTQSGGVYEVNAQDVAHQVFYSNKIKSEFLYAAGGTVYILGKIRESTDERVYAYSLTSQENTTPENRIIDILPTEAGRLPGVIEQNFVGNKLLIQLAVPISKTQKQSGIGITNTVFNEKQQVVRNELTALGIDTSTLDIRFTY